MAHIKKTLIYALILVILAFTLFPLVYTVAASFKSNAEILANPGAVFPRDVTFDNYKIIWSAEEFNVRRLVWNSTYYTVLIVLAVVTSSAMAGYTFSRGDFPGKKLVFAVFTSLMFINLGGTTYIPLLNIVKRLGLHRSLWGLIVVKAFSVQIVYIYLVRSYVDALPKELDEAARMDGCSFMGIFFRIIAPLLKPIIAAICILVFQGSWNEYLMPTVFTLSNPSQRTLVAGVVALKNSGAAASQWNLMLAGSVVSILPVLTVYAFANKYFVAGLSSGAVKG